MSALGRGDGTVLRASALLDERSPADMGGRVDTPLHWDSVTWLRRSHLALTRDPIFLDNLFYWLREEPRPAHSNRPVSAGLPQIAAPGTRQ